MSGLPWGQAPRHAQTHLVIVVDRQASVLLAYPSEGIVIHAAAELGFNRSKMYRRLKKYSIDPKDYR